MRVLVLNCGSATVKWRLYEGASASRSPSWAGARRKRVATRTRSRSCAGGIWRDFLSRYPEANWMHKRMLELSGRLADRPALAAAP